MDVIFVCSQPVKTHSCNVVYIDFIAFRVFLRASSEKGVVWAVMLDGTEYGSHGQITSAGLRFSLVFAPPSHRPSSHSRPPPVTAASHQGQPLIYKVLTQRGPLERTIVSLRTPFGLVWGMFRAVQSSFFDDSIEEMALKISVKN